MQVIRKRELLTTAALVAVAVAATALRRSRRRPVRSVADETLRVRDVYDREAARYDSMIRIPERLLLGDGRSWAASEAFGDTLEIAAGTGRNFPHYRTELRITGQDISAEMLKIARVRRRSAERSSYASAMHRISRLQANNLIPSSVRSRSALFPTIAVR